MQRCTWMKSESMSDDEALASMPSNHKHKRKRKRSTQEEDYHVDSLATRQQASSRFPLGLCSNRRAGKLEAE